MHISYRFFQTVATMFLSLVTYGQGAYQIGPRTYEFWEDKSDASEPYRSLALVSPPERSSVSGALRDRPTFGFTSDFRYSACFKLEPGTDLYGTGEIAGPLRRNGRVTECWNTDAFNYSANDPSLYQSHPWVLAVRRDGTSFGALADTTYRCRIDLRNGILFAADGPRFPIIVIEGKTPQEVVMRLGDLTGHMKLPPEWALGYHQCRWSYMSQDEALGIALEFRKRHIPCDAIWFDIDYMDGFRIFTFNKQTFPNPKELNEKLAAQGFHNVWMIDPGVKIDANYSVYASGKAKNVFVNNRLGYLQSGDVWPGACAFPDFTRPETREWWSDLYRPWLSNGITGVWNDMNEPSFFNVASKTMPEEAVHRGGSMLTEGPHAEYHNVYGRLMAQATYEGMRAANPDKRPFVLTRAGYIGYQQYAATWTGDNASTWTDLQNAIPMILNLGLSGQPFAGPDIPGFAGDGPSESEERKKFFARWWGLGSMLPFSRGHATKGSVRKEPWAFGPEVEEAARKALWRRYVLMPYLYTTFHEAAITGLPVARPLFFADPSDLQLRNEDRGFLLGGDIAVAAQVAPGKAEVSMPKGWVPLPLDANDPELPQLWIRPGAIVPLGMPHEFVGQKPLNRVWFVVCPDSQGKASGRAYEDAGDGYGYQKGDYLLTTYSATLNNDTLRFYMPSIKGSLSRQSRFATDIVFKNGSWFEVEGDRYTKPPTYSIPHGSRGLETVGPVYRTDFGGN